MITLKVEEIYEDATIKVEGVIEGGVSPPYEGEYTITPKVSQQEFETKNKRMKEDLTVLSIPYSQVSNPQGGLTVNIAFD